MEPGTEIVFQRNAVDVLFDRTTGMGCLTDLWRAKGSPANKQPSQWTRLQQSVELINALARLEDTDAESLIETRAGGHGGTWAHWQLVTVYAHYLDASFYLAWNRWAMAHISGAPVANTTLDAVAAQLRELNATLIEIRAQHAQQARALPAPLHPDAAAILRIVRASTVPLAPAHVARLLATEGIDRDPRAVRVRLSRLVARGQLIHAGHGLYAAVDTIEA